MKKLNEWIDAELNKSSWVKAGLDIYAQCSNVQKKLIKASSILFFVLVTYTLTVQKLVEKQQVTRDSIATMAELKNLLVNHKDRLTKTSTALQNRPASDLQNLLRDIATNIELYPEFIMNSSNSSVRAAFTNVSYIKVSSFIGDLEKKGVIIDSLTLTPVSNGMVNFSLTIN